MLRLLLDENVSPSLPPDLAQLGVDALPIRNRGMLGADDHELWRFAQLEERTLVTINGKHFYKLAAQSDRHHGAVIIPSGGARGEQFGYIASAVTLAVTDDPFDPNLLNKFVEVEEDGTVASQLLFADMMRQTRLRRCVAGDDPSVMLRFCLCVHALCGWRAASSYSAPLAPYAAY
jgi:predicted nuclease of predicted toxin-antitoxin system